MDAMKRLLIGLAISALVLAGCSKQKQAEQRTATSSSNSAGKVILSTTVAPNSAFRMSVSFDPSPPRMSSKTRFRLNLTDASGASVSQATVQASLVMPLMDMGKNEFPLQPVGNGVYEGTGQFTMSGEWEVIFNGSAGSRTGRTTFNVRVED